MDFYFVSPSPNKHQSNSEAALISNKIENKKEKTLFNIDFKDILGNSFMVNKQYISQVYPKEIVKRISRLSSTKCSNKTILACISVIKLIVFTIPNSYY